MGARRFCPAAVLRGRLFGQNTDALAAQTQTALSFVQRPYFMDRVLGQNGVLRGRSLDKNRRAGRSALGLHFCPPAVLHCRLAGQKSSTTSYPQTPGVILSKPYFVDALTYIVLSEPYIIPSMPYIVAKTTSQAADMIPVCRRKTFNKTKKTNKTPAGHFSLSIKEEQCRSNSPQPPTRASRRAAKRLSPDFAQSHTPQQ